MARLTSGDQSVRHAVETEFLHPYTDVQYYTMVAVTSIAQQVYQQQNQRKQSKRKDEKVDTTPDQAERLMELLMMIPIATSQKDLDQSGGYLFPPPKDAEPDTKKNSEDSDSDESSEDEEEDETESADGPPRKSQD
jgi:U3 small nucleolar RNA-associated protein 19